MHWWILVTLAGAKPPIGTGTAAGTLTFGAGIFDINTMELGYVTANIAVAGVAGTVNVNGSATLRVNNYLRLGQNPGASVTAKGNFEYQWWNGFGQCHLKRIGHYQYYQSERRNTGRYEHGGHNCRADRHVKSLWRRNTAIECQRRFPSHQCRGHRHGKHRHDHH